MTELRKDYILDRYVIIADARGKRPHEFREEKQDKKVEKCFFCPGNENLTPPETGRIGDEKGWRIRWFPNKFSAVDAEGQVEIRTDNDFYTFANAVGFHEVIVETPNHEEELHQLSIERIYEVLKVYSDRIDDGMRRAEYAVLFKNHGAKAGTSIKHSHTQMIAYNQVPPLIKSKVEASKRYFVCPYCRIIDSEKGSDRRITESNTMVSFTPYASEHPFEAWIFPKRHIRQMHEMTNDEFYELASSLKQILVRLAELNASYNFMVQQSPAGENMHLHFEIKPRLSTWAGFELAGGTIINPVSPEEAARFYRGEK
ncbi:DUF4931 domain-containing protein [Candidatus Woesearchaeota archaeon]|nr:MAG: DUF4931 domain-containing protein [Candidatus Woesearchaeota archaeon]